MDVKLPNLGEGADSGVVVTVFVSAGDTVEKDQAIIELENEKAVASIPSPSAGTVSQVYVKQGDKLTVGQPILALGKEAGETDSPAPSAAAPSANASQTDVGSSAPAPEPEPKPAATEEPVGPVSGPPAASPSIRRLAMDLGLDLSKVRGSARGGRVIMADLRAYIQRLEKLAATRPTTAIAPKRTAAPAVDFAQWGPVQVKPLSPLRQTIGRRMTDSWHLVPRVTQFDEADVTRIDALRKEHRAAYEAKGVRLTLTTFVLKAVVDTLRQHPVLNTSLDESGENLVYKSYFHIGLAVDTEAGLIVPVIRDADKKSLVELSRDIVELAAKARDRKVTAEDLKGGTFTISNQGGIGGAHFTPVVNVPEVAILGVGRGAVKPVWNDGKVEPRTLMPLALSYDHRVIDGANAARFITDLVQGIEQFDEGSVKI